LKVHEINQGNKSVTTTPVISPLPVLVTVIVYDTTSPTCPVKIFHVLIILTFPVPAGGGGESESTIVIQYDVAHDNHCQRYDASLHKGKPFRGQLHQTQTISQLKNIW
jgi:hypothetical protein